MSNVNFIMSFDNFAHRCCIKQNDKVLLITNDGEDYTGVVENLDFKRIKLYTNEGLMDLDVNSVLSCSVL